MALLVFKTSVGLNKVPGGFDSHPPPPTFFLDMFRRTPQPPVNPATRALERRGFWPGAVACLAALILLSAGAVHRTGLDTVEESAARETQLIKAFSSGGLHTAAN